MNKTKAYVKNGGAELVIASGGKITVESGGEIEAIAGSTVTGLTGQTTFADSAEVIAGVENAKVIAPDTLKTLTSTATRNGLIELATDAEVQTGTDVERAVTPAGLRACTSTTTRIGVVEMATAAEALAGADTGRAVTPAGLQGSLGNLELISFVGKNLAGACTATGLKVGDLVLSVTGVVAADVGDMAAKFEATITVNDQIQQSAAENLSTKVYMALIHRKS